MKISDTTDEAWIAAFNEQAKEIIGCSADDLYKIKNDETEDIFQQKLKELLCIPRLFRVVTQAEYMNEKKLKIAVMSQSAVDYSAESSMLLEEISKKTESNI